MTDLICDTSFLIHTSSVRIHNIDSLDSEIGEVSFVVPDIVLDELRRLAASNPDAARTLERASKYRTIKMAGGGFADAAIVDYVRRHGGMVATMDRDLKRKVKDVGGSAVSVSNDSIVLES